MSDSEKGPAESRDETDPEATPSRDVTVTDTTTWAQHPFWRFLGLFGAAIAAAISIARIAGWADSSLFLIVAVLSGVVALVTLVMTRLLTDWSFRQALIGTGSTLLAVLVLVALLARLDRVIEAPPMTGDFRIAVAEFGEINENGETGSSDAATSLSDSVYRFLFDEVEEFADLTGDDIQIRSPADTGSISGSDRESRARAARTLGEEIKADLVLYGVLDSANGKPTFTPEFILTSRKLGQAEELVGHYELGAPIISSGSVDDAQKPIRQDLKARTIAFARFVIGLSSYRLGDFEAALGYFDDALSEQTPTGEEAWRDEDGKEMLYLFLGNAAGKTGDMEEAALNYQKALTLSNGQFARAWVGMGEVDRARSGCGDNSETSTTSSELLDDAYDAYETSETAAFQPAVSQIKAKAAFGKGRIHVCRSLNGEDEWTQARDQFNMVLAEYKTQSGEVNPRVQRLAAEAHLFIGLVTVLEADPATDSVYREAIAAYELSLDLHQDDPRRALIYGWLGWLHAHLPEEAAAAEENCRTANILGLNPETELCP